MKFSERQEKYYAKLHQRARRNRKTIREALKWLDDNYTGSNTRKAIRHQMEAEEWQSVVELQLRLVYKTLLRKEKAIERSGLEMKSYVEELSERYGWPLKIKARGYVAYLCDIQPLNTREKPLPVYRFPGGRSLVDEREMIPFIE